MTEAAPLTRRRADAVWMAAGTLGLGISGFVFLAAVGRGPLDPSVAAALSSVYLLSNILGPGVFVAVEQETSRRISAPVPDSGTAGARSTTGGATVVLTVLTLAVLAIGGATFLRPVLRGDLVLLTTLAVAVVGSAAVARVRGQLGGRRRFRRYAVSLVVDAGVRIAGVLGLLMAGSTAGAAFALALCAGPAVAALVTWPRRPAPERGGPGGGSAIALLVVGSVLAMLLANLAPVVVNVALPDDPARAFAFACALVLTRAPLLLTTPLQAMLLPDLALAAARGEPDRIRHQLRRGLEICAGLGVIAITGAYFLGRPVITLMFGRDADLMTAPVVALLTGSAVVLMAVAVVQPALIALGGHRALVIGWATGTIAFVGTFLGVHGAGGVDPVAAAVAAALIAPTVTLLVQLSLARRLR